MNSKPEIIIRDGVEVSYELQKVWAAELDLFAKLKDVLQKYNLKYFASGGTLLGAVRHKGFIPWDDDIDIMMLREDYEKLLEVADKEFSQPYFFQTAFSDKNYYRGHAQLRNSNTTAILPYEADRASFNQGIFIDIFPTDAIPDDEKQAEKQRRRLHGLNRLLNNGARIPEWTTGSVSEKIKRAAVSIISIFFSHKKQYLKMEEVCKMYNHQKTKLIGFLSFDPNNEHLKYPRELFVDSVEFPFENLSISAPSGWHQMLTKQYGDYMVMKKAPSYHGGLIFDTETPYKEYLAKMKNKK